MAWVGLCQIWDLLDLGQSEADRVRSVWRPCRKASHLLLASRWPNFGSESDTTLVQSVVLNLQGARILQVRVRGSVMVGVFCLECVVVFVEDKQYLESE